MDKPLPVYSDFSHMNGIGNIRFAVGLREDNADQLIARVFPMTKFVPKPIAEKKPKAAPKKIEERPCMRPDCAARKERLNELKDENKGLKFKVKALADKLETAKNKIALADKSIILAEEKNDSLNGQIDEARNRIISIEQEVTKTDKFNIALRNQLAALQQEIANINLETENQTQQLQDLIENKKDRQIIFSKHPKQFDNLLAEEVSILKFSNDDDDSD